jgi:hypothetical protein
MDAAESASQPLGVPPPIKEKDVVFDIDFHPTQPVIACGLVTGAVNV